VIQVTDTILHEIAHALTLGDGHGYGSANVLRLVQNPKDAIRIKILFHLQ
jgi:hypothetical protein